MQPPLCFGYLASYLRKYDEDRHDLKVIDENTGENTEREIEKFSPDVVAITSSTPMICRAIEIVDFVKTNYHDTFVVFGGNHVTPIPKESAREINADVIVVGEGEITFFELIQLLKNNKLTHNTLKNVKGVCYKNNNKIILTEPRPLINDLDIIPFPARDLFDMKYYLNSPAILGTKILKTTQIMTGRGCPYSCVFCTCPLVHKHRTRFFSPEYVVEEIEKLIDEYKIEGLKFVDDSFTVNKPRATRICEMIIERGINKKIAFGVQARADQIYENDRDFLRLLKKANCIEMEYGFESGSPKILKFLKANTTTVEDNSRVIKLTNESGICVLGYFMVGTVGETYEDIKMTINFIKKHKKMITSFGLAITTAYPGTKLWDVCKEKGLLKDIKWDDYIIDNFATLKKPPRCFSDVFTKEELVSIHRKILMIMVKSYPWKIRLKKILRNPIKIITVGIPYFKHRVGIGENDM
jgi:radical SAM superfamily enzyme YgiQ (UPF0313 family)